MYALNALRVVTERFKYTINQPRIFEFTFCNFCLNLCAHKRSCSDVQYLNPKPAVDAEGGDGPHDKDFSHVWQFFEIVSGIGCDRLSQLRLLFALAEEFYKNPSEKGLTIAELAHRASLPLEAARYGIRALRVEQLVTRASRLGRVEFFHLTPDAHEAMATCLRAFGIIAAQEPAPNPMTGYKGRRPVIRSRPGDPRNL